MGNGESLNSVGYRNLILVQKDISVEDLADGGVRIVHRPPKNSRSAMLPLACFVLGLFSLAGGWYLLENPFVEPAKGQVPTAPFILMILGCLNVCMGPLIYVIWKLQGPPRDAILDVWPGKLKADRCFAGDRAVNAYGPSEITCLFVEENILWAAARMGDTQLVPFGNAEAHRATATLIASHLWQTNELLCGTTILGGVQRWIVAPAAESQSVKS